MLRPLIMSLTIVSLAACGPNSGDTTAGSGTETGDPPAMTTGSTGTPGGTTEAEPTTSDPGPTTSEPEGTTTAPTDPPSACAPAPCVTRIDYPCGEFGEDCVDPCEDYLLPADCGGAELCPEVAIKTQGSDDYEVVESEADALCVLQALRDRTPGRVRLVWGDPQGFFGDVGTGIHATIHILGDGDAVLMDWDWEYNTCCTATYARIRGVGLQPAAFFDDCLTDPTTASLIDCFTAGSTPYDPAPDGWLPPWLVACDGTLPKECPG